ncbi:gag-pol polyprotein [Tanacetum coccineum]
MTRSSTNELFTPYQEPEREFRSSRRHFKSLSLDELRSPDFNLLSDQEYLEEEEAEAMVETMEQYMSKTRTDYGSGILDSRGAVPTKTAADAKIAIQEMAEYSQKWHNGTSRGRSTETSNGIAAIQAQLNNLGREIKKVNEKVYADQVGCEQCKGPHYTKDCPLKDEGASVSVMPLLTYLNLGLGELAHTKLTMELADRIDIKVPLILERPFLSTARAKIDVYKRKITLRVREEKIIFKSVKPASRPRERNIDEYWWRIYKSGDLEVLES